MKRTIVLLALSALACGEKNGGTGGGAKPSADVSAGVAAANAAVPADLEATLVFEAGKGEDDRSVIVVPKGWKTGVMPGDFQPPDGVDLGFMTRYGVSNNCDGACEPKNWQEVADKVEFARFKDGFQVEKDEQQPGSRFLVAKSNDKAYVVAAWWKDGAKRYHTCRATLDGKAAAALAAFEAACRATEIIDW